MSRSHLAVISDNIEEDLSPISRKIADQQRLALIPLKEDLAQWISSLTGVCLGDGHDLMESLQTGVVLCNLANVLCEHMQLYREMHKHECHENFLNIPRGPKYREKAQPRSFFARDNAANFIEWCHKLNVDKYCMFESEDLVRMNKSRNVLLCLLDLARIASRYGVHTPELISLEQEIDKEEKKCENLKMELNLDENVNIVLPPTVCKRKRTKVLNLDDVIHSVIDNPPFNGLIDLVRIGEGRYKIEGKAVFIRVLRRRHVMVRVGGGWDTLHHYLITHDSGRYTPFARLTHTPKTESHRAQTAMVRNTPLSAVKMKPPLSAVKSKATPRNTKSSTSGRFSSKRKLMASVTDLDGNVLKTPITVNFNS